MSLSNWLKFRVWWMELEVLGIASFLIREIRIHNLIFELDAKEIILTIR